MSIYVLIVRALSERFVTADLTEAGYDAFSPIITRWERTEHGRRIKTHRPMLPRYVFAETADLDRDFDALRHSRRVSGMIGDQHGPRALTDEGAAWVGGLALQQGLGAFDYTAKTKPKMTISQQVRIVAKAWTGHVGRIVELTDKTVSVHVPGRLGGKITMNRDQVEAVDEEKAA